MSHRPPIFSFCANDMSVCLCRPMVLVLVSVATLCANCQQSMLVKKNKSCLFKSSFVNFQCDRQFFDSAVYDIGGESSCARLCIECVLCGAGRCVCRQCFALALAFLHHRIASSSRATSFACSLLFCLCILIYFF